MHYNYCCYSYRSGEIKEESNVVEETAVVEEPVILEEPIVVEETYDDYDHFVELPSFDLSQFCVQTPTTSVCCN